MAGIDKTYVSNWNDFKEIRDWAISVGTVDDEYGNKITPINWFYHPDLTEEEFEENKAKKLEQVKNDYKKHPSDFKYYIENYGEDCIGNPDFGWFEVVVWNTWTPFDIWLMRNCPLQIIQDRLHQQYSDEFIDSVMNHTSVYDTFHRNGVKDPHFSVEWIANYKFKDDKLWWWIEPYQNSDDLDCDYYPSQNMWYFEREAKLHIGVDSIFISTVCDDFHGQMSMRKIYRLLRKWNLPKGFKLKFTGTYSPKNVKGHYCYKEFIVTVK